MRSKNNADRPPRGVLVFWRPEKHEYSWQSLPTRYDFFASYLFENEAKARWRTLEPPSNTNPAKLLSMIYGLKYVPIGSETDCSSMQIMTILDEASAKSFEVLYFADSNLLDIRRNAEDFYDLETLRDSINDADLMIRHEQNEKFWKENPRAFD